MLASASATHRRWPRCHVLRAGAQVGGDARAHARATAGRPGPCRTRSRAAGSRSRNQSLVDASRAFRAASPRASAIDHVPSPMGPDSFFPTPARVVFQRASANQSRSRRHGPIRTRTPACCVRRRCHRPASTNSCRHAHTVPSLARACARCPPRPSTIRRLALDRDRPWCRPRRPPPLSPQPTPCRPFQHTVCVEPAARRTPVSPPPRPASGGPRGRRCACRRPAARSCVPVHTVPSLFTATGNPRPQRSQSPLLRSPSRATIASFAASPSALESCFHEHGPSVCARACANPRQSPRRSHPIATGGRHRLTVVPAQLAGAVVSPREHRAVAFNATLWIRPPRSSRRRQSHREGVAENGGRCRVGRTHCRPTSDRAGLERPCADRPATASPSGRHGRGLAPLRVVPSPNWPTQAPRDEVAAHDEGGRWRNPSR